MARVAASDVRTTEAASNDMIATIGLDPLTVTPKMVRQKVRENQPEETEGEKNRTKYYILFTNPPREYEGAYKLLIP